MSFAATKKCKIEKTKLFIGNPPEFGYLWSVLQVLFPNLQHQFWMHRPLCADQLKWMGGYIGWGLCGGFDCKGFQHAHVDEYQVTNLLSDSQGTRGMKHTDCNNMIQSIRCKNHEREGRKQQAWHQKKAQF